MSNKLYRYTGPSNDLFTNGKEYLSDGNEFTLILSADDDEFWIVPEPRYFEPVTAETQNDEQPSYEEIYAALFYGVTDEYTDLYKQVDSL